MMDRRRFLLTSLAGAVATPLATGAQPSGRIFRLGILVPTERPKPGEPPGTVAHLLAGLRGLGYVDGQNMVVESRYSDGKVDRLPGLARELVQLKVDVIMAISSSALSAARAATTTIPIVMMASWNTDLVGRGFFASLARPGGNITGVLNSAEGTLAGKRLELIREAVPRSTRIGVLSRDELGTRPQLEEAAKAESSLGIKLVIGDVQDRQYDQAFAKITAERSAGLLVLSSPVFFRDMTRIIALAAKHRLPAIYDWRENAEAGGLMAYGSSLGERSRRAAIYVDRIFKGANPGDQPIEQPTKFDLVINLKTAKALGLTIPPALLARADQVIE